MPVSCIGVDLDNTLVSYDDVLFRVGVEKGWLGSECPRGKKAIRDTVRDLPNGEVCWQELQAEIYGPRMGEARLIEGVDAFFRECRRRSVPVYIVSHKTRFAGYDTTGTDLRAKAVAWLEAQGFFDPERLGLPYDRVFFGSTREEKIQRIKMLGCTAFVDDLEETFQEPSFPPAIEKVLFDRHALSNPRPGIKVCATWAEITTCLLGG